MFPKQGEQIRGVALALLHLRDGGQHVPGDQLDVRKWEPMQAWVGHQRGRMFEGTFHGQIKVEPLAVAVGR